MSNELSMYDLTRDWWNFAFENPEKIKPIHTALYMFAIEHCNRLAWKRKFGLPTTMAMEAIGVKSYNTYISAFKDLVDWGFFILIEKSKNQHSSNIVALSNNDKAHDKALDKAMYKHDTKHTSKQSESTRQSTVSINIPNTNNHIPNTNIPNTSEFERFWNLYNKKVDKKKCEKKWKLLTKEQRTKIFETLPAYIESTPNVKFRKNPYTYLNNESWNDEIVSATKNTNNGLFETTVIDGGTF